MANAQLGFSGAPRPGGVFVYEVHVAIVPWSRDPSFAADDWTRRWPQIQADMGLAQNTVDACGRGLEDLRSHNPPARG